MILGRRWSELTGCALVLSFGLWSSAAAALQPLEEFVAAAQSSSSRGVEAVALMDESRSEEAAATWQLLPRFSASASYTRNQYERLIQFPGTAQSEAIVAQDQLDAALTLSVPLVDVGAWEQRKTSRRSHELAEANAATVELEISQRVVRAYYQLLASAAVDEAADTNLQLAEKHLVLARQRQEAGFVTPLDVLRAEADVARATKDRAAASLGLTVAAHELESASGLPPEGVTTFPRDDLTPEAPLGEWLSASTSSPRQEAARAAERLSQAQAKAARAFWYPTVTGTAQQRFTNATALTGEEAYYLLQVSAAWKFDGALLHRKNAAQARSRAAVARTETAARRTEDEVFDAWHRVESGIVAAHAAREQSEAAAEALRMAEEMYAAGVATQLEVLSARQGAFAAEVSRIQAEADLGYRRVALRLVASAALDSAHP